MSLALIPVTGRVEALYRSLSDENSLCREKLYINLGYWKDDPADLDSAAEALADLCAQTASLSKTDEILDAGFGFADQDIFWAEKYDLKSIHGINISGEQVALARQRVRELGLADRIFLERGDASRLPFPDSRFDAVIAVESAFHFKTREDFFREAHRVLKPGGRLALADLAAASKPLALKDRLAEIIGRSFWQIPKENLYPKETYQKKLETLGFAPVKVDSIWEHVYPRFVDYARARLQDEDLIERMNPAYRRMLSGSLKMRRKLSQRAMDYLLVRAIKRP